MCGIDWRRALGAFGLCVAVLANGCANSPGGQSGSRSNAIAARPPGGFGPVGAGGPTPPTSPGGPPGPVNLAGYNQLAEYQAADLSQKLAELQDENKSLLARLQGVQGLLEERERAVLSARNEAQAATQEVTRARQELTRCRQEIASLREVVRSADKENQASMHSLVTVLESILDRGNPPTSSPTKEKDPPKRDAVKPAVRH